MRKRRFKNLFRNGIGMKPVFKSSEPGPALSATALAVADGAIPVALIGKLRHLGCRTSVGPLVRHEISIRQN